MLHLTVPGAVQTILVDEEPATTAMASVLSLFWRKISLHEIAVHSPPDQLPIETSRARTPSVSTTRAVSEASDTFDESARAI